MPTPKKETPKVDRVESLRSEIVEILEELLHELNVAAEKDPGEHNAEPIRNAQIALRIFKPEPPNVYT